MTGTTEGSSYTNTGGLSTPFLVDNNWSASAGTVTLTACTSQDQSGDDVTNTILFIVKDDVNLNQRLYVRVMQ